MLGLLDGAKPQPGGLMVRCPFHAEKTASCSVWVRTDGDGTIGVNCFGCGATGNLYHLIAQVRGLDVRRDFERLIELALEMAGTGLDVPPPAPRRAAPANPARDYPPADEVTELWTMSLPATKDNGVASWMCSRDLDPAAVESQDLARGLSCETAPIRWARTRAGAWTDTGYRCLVPMFDELGRLRSVRARRVVTGGDGPKALPPTGYRVSGLIMADPLARQILQRGGLPDFWPANTELQIAICEGEPDFLKYATAWPDSDLTSPAIFGVVAGSWTHEIAARIPDGADVAVLTHPDAAGEKYAAQIIETLRGRVTLRRGEP